MGGKAVRQALWRSVLLTRPRFLIFVEPPRRAPVKTGRNRRKTDIAGGPDTTRAGPFRRAQHLPDAPWDRPEAYNRDPCGARITDE